jgi:hypothetical protein
MRVIRLNPDTYEALERKRYYLEPKWHGSAEEMLRFGRQCLLSGAWHNRQPFILVMAHLWLGHYSDRGYLSRPDRAYFTKSPEIWKDFQAVFEGYLSRYPRSSFQRSLYAKFACYCEQWKVAHKQFQTLGDKASAGAFIGGQSEMEAFRKEAADKAGE